MEPAERVATVEALAEQVRTLTDAMRRMEEKSLQERNAEPEPDVPLPEKFSGIQAQYPGFKMDCELLFMLKPRTYTRDFVKVRTAIVLLSGKIKTWAHQLLVAESPSLLTWGSFIKEMDSWMGRPQPRSGARVLSTPRRPVRLLEGAYRPAAPKKASGTGGAARNANMGRSLSRMNDCLDAKPREPMYLPEEAPGSDTHDVAFHQDEPPEESQAMSLDDEPLDEEEPMVLGCCRSMHSLGEQARRRHLGLCFYCGHRGHLISFCPVRPPRPVHKETSPYYPDTTSRPGAGYLGCAYCHPHLNLGKRPTTRTQEYTVQGQYLTASQSVAAEPVVHNLPDLQVHIPKDLQLQSPPDSPLCPLGDISEDYTDSEKTEPAMTSENLLMVLQQQMPMVLNAVEVLRVNQAALLHKENQREQASVQASAEQPLPPELLQADSPTVNPGIEEPGPGLMYASNGTLIRKVDEQFFEGALQALAKQKEGKRKSKNKRK